MRWCIITVLNFCQDTHDWSDEECATQVDMFFAREPLDFRPIFENHLNHELFHERLLILDLMHKNNFDMPEEPPSSTDQNQKKSP